MDVTLILCDAAQEASGKLHVLGGGWTHAVVMPGSPLNLALGLVIGVPWDRTNERHAVRALLLTADGEPVSVNDRPVALGQSVELGRPAGLKPGTTLNAVLTMQFTGLLLEPGGYVWEVQINDKEGARAPFWIVQAPGV